MLCFLETWGPGSGEEPPHSHMPGLQSLRRDTDHQGLANCLPHFPSPTSSPLAALLASHFRCLFYIYI